MKHPSIPVLRSDGLLRAGQEALCALCAVFLALLTALTVGQIAETSPLFPSRILFLGFMCTAIAALLIMGGLSILRSAHLLTLLCPCAVLVGLGSCYQLLFQQYGKFCLTILLALAAAAGAYLLWRRINLLDDRMFSLVTGAIVLLLVLNVLFGQECYGSRQAIPLGPVSLHPGEFIKVLLILQGAACHQNLRRCRIYFLTSLAACGVMLLFINDLGCAVVIFAIALLMSYLLLDDRRLSVGVILLAAVLFLVLVSTVPHARTRMTWWLDAMDPANPSFQQRSYIQTVLCGGFTGLGVEDAWRMTGIFAAEHDGALAGVMAVYGVPAAAVAALAYGALIALPAFSRSVFPSGYLLLAQTSLFVFCQVTLNLCGALDVLPFTGLVAPLISEGLNAGICFGLLLGLCAAALHPHIDPPKEE